jgi:nucleotide-binding universal stress UspA family protein
MPDTWTVGYDGSKSSRNALRWTLATASSRDVVIRVVTVLEATIASYADAYVMDATVTQVTADMKAQARSDLEEAINAERRGSDSAVEVVIADGHPARELLRRSEDARLLVVGSRGRGGFTRLLLGSVSHQCATHARIPTVVVPTESRRQSVERVLVGVDGSERSRRALDWVLAFAPSAEITVLRAWEPPGFGHTLVADEIRQLVEEQEAELKRFADEVGSAGDRRLHHEFVKTASAGRALVEASSEFDLVAVGEQGLGAVGSALLGSVANYAAHRAQVPTVIVPVPEAEDT